MADQNFPLRQLVHFVECTTLPQTETLWKNLTADGQILMPFGEYPLVLYMVG